MGGIFVVLQSAEEPLQLPLGVGVEAEELYTESLLSVRVGRDVRHPAIEGKQHSVGEGKEDGHLGVLGEQAGAAEEEAALAHVPDEAVLGGAVGANQTDRGMGSAPKRPPA